MVGPLISSVRLWEFKGIRACEEPIRLSRFTVLIGRNNSGKTSVLEALALLPYSLLRRGPTNYNLQPFRKSWSDALNILHGGLSSLIYGYTGKAKINYLVKGNMITRILSTSGEIRTLINNEELAVGIIAPRAYESEYEKRLADIMGIKDPEELLFSIIFLPNDSFLLSSLAKEIASITEWAKVEKSGANVAIVRDLIAKAVHDRFTEATVRFNSIVLRKELPDGRVIYVKAADLGDGVERVLIYGLWLETYKPKVVLWDDIEASAHPGLIEAVLEWLASRDWQVVLTTHSYDVLERLVAIEPEGASVVVLKKGADDVLEPRVLSLDELREMLESHVDVRKVVDIL